MSLYAPMELVRVAPKTDARHLASHQSKMKRWQCIVGACLLGMVAGVVLIGVDPRHLLGTSVHKGVYEGGDLFLGGGVSYGSYRVFKKHKQNTSDFERLVELGGRVLNAEGEEDKKRELRAYLDWKFSTLQKSGASCHAAIAELVPGRRLATANNYPRRVDLPRFVDPVPGEQQHPQAVQWDIFVGMCGAASSYFAKKYIASGGNLADAAAEFQEGVPWEVVVAIPQTYPKEETFNPFVFEMLYTCLKKREGFAEAFHALTTEYSMDEPTRAFLEELFTASGSYDPTGWQSYAEFIAGRLQRKPEFQNYKYTIECLQESLKAGHPRGSMGSLCAEAVGLSVTKCEYTFGNELARKCAALPEGVYCLAIWGEGENGGHMVTLTKKNGVYGFFDPNGGTFAEIQGTAFLDKVVAYYAKSPNRMTAIYHVES